MDFMGTVIAAICAAVLGFIVGRESSRSPSEDEMLARLIRLRADRYIGAVAKTKVEDEIKEAATKQATQRLAEQGVQPGNQ